MFRTVAQLLGWRAWLCFGGSNSHFDQAIIWRLSLGFLGWIWGGVLFLGWRLWWRGVSCLTCLVASHAVLTWRAGEGGGLILPALAKSAPTLPSPPRHPGTARCAACGGAGRNACSRIPVQAHTGSHGQGVSRSDNLCSQCAEDGSPLVRAQGEVTQLMLGRARPTNTTSTKEQATPPQPSQSQPGK